MGVGLGARQRCDGRRPDRLLGVEIPVALPDLLKGSLSDPGVSIGIAALFTSRG